MAEPATIAIGIKEIGNAIVIGVGGFLMWLLKKSIFGRMDKMERDMGEAQSKTMCVVMQTGCQKLLLDKMDSVEKVAKERMGALVEKIESQNDKIQLVLDRQTQVINRIDSHINGHNHEK